MPSPSIILHSYRPYELLKGFWMIDWQKAFAGIIVILLSVLAFMGAFAWNSINQMQTDVAVIKTRFESINSQYSDMKVSQGKLWDKLTTDEEKMQATDLKADAAMANECADCAKREAEGVRHSR